MQPLFILGLAFTLLATYIESDLTSEETAVSQVYTAKVIRDEVHDKKPASIITDISELPSASDLTVETIRARTNTSPELVNNKKIDLNLTIPTQSRSELLLRNKNYSMPNLFKFSKKPTITYEAELVYDAEKGEDITGGKVNITIPFG